MNDLDRQERLLDRLTGRVATIGFSGLVVIALLTMADALARWSGLPRIPGFNDFNQVIFAVVIATCFPAGLLRANNVAVRFLGSALGAAATRWLEVFGALLTLAFFSMLAWRFVIMTADFQANARVTQTIELPIAPWWWLTTAIMLLCIPIQAWVVADRLVGALRGETRKPLPERLEETVGE